MFSFSCVNVHSKCAAPYSAHKPLLAQLNGKQKVVPVVGKILQPTVLQVLRGKLAPHSFFLNTAGSGFHGLQHMMFVWLD